MDIKDIPVILIPKKIILIKAQRWLKGDILILYSQNPELEYTELRGGETCDNDHLWKETT